MSHCYLQLHTHSTHSQTLLLLLLRLFIKLKNDLSFDFPLLLFKYLINYSCHSLILEPSSSVCMFIGAAQAKE